MMKDTDVSLGEFQDSIVNRMVGVYGSSKSAVIRYIVTHWITEHISQIDERVARYEEWRRKQS